MKDYYEVLGVSKNAPLDQIKTAYRKQALQWHPDRNKSPEATDRFKEINKAYEVLSDPKKKEIYDQYGAAAFERMNAAQGGPQTHSYRQGPFTYTYTTNFGGEGMPSGDFGGFSDPFEIFEQFFGFHSPFSGHRARARPTYQVTLSFEEAVKGVEKGVLVGQKSKNIKIPAGIDDNMRIRFSDFDLVVQVQPHPYFKRDGQDIYYEKEIPYPLAVLGGFVEIPSINGSIKLKVHAGTQSGRTVRLSGKGIPYPQSNRRGDMYVVFTVKVPARVSSRAKTLLEELEREL